MELFETSFPERLMMKTYDESGNILTVWDEAKGWFEDGTEQNEFEEWIMTRVYHPYTDKQLEEIQLAKEKAALTESRRELTLEEVAALFVKSQANTVDIPDQTSLRMKGFYPAFDEVIGQTVKQGFKFTYGDQLYKTIQPNLLIQEQYPPENGTESLYTKINWAHTGAIYDPIPYSGNMELFTGKYYSQNGVLYLCSRNTQSPVHHTLKDLIGLYVERIENA